MVKPHAPAGVGRNTISLRGVASIALGIRAAREALQVLMQKIPLTRIPPGVIVIITQGRLPETQSSCASSSIKRTSACAGSQDEKTLHAEEDGHRAFKMEVPQRLRRVQCQDQLRSLLCPLQSRARHRRLLQVAAARRPTLALR